MNTPSDFGSNHFAKLSECDRVLVSLLDSER
jgi:hypothetical protein